jgi:FAD:protein FMN transferase
VLEVRNELRRTDATCSRFRDDSDLARVNAAGGERIALNPWFAEALEVALAAAKATGGLVSPTVGGALVRIGYDRDFSLVPAHAATSGPPTRTGARARMAGHRCGHR